MQLPLTLASYISFVLCQWWEINIQYALWEMVYFLEFLCHTCHWVTSTTFGKFDINWFYFHKYLRDFFPLGYPEFLLRNIESNILGGKQFLFFPPLSVSALFWSWSQTLFFFLSFLEKFCHSQQRVLSWILDLFLLLPLTLPAAQMVKNLPAMQETQIWPLGGEAPLDKGMATHSSVLAWRIPWIEEHGGL